MVLRSAAATLLPILAFSFAACGKIGPVRPPLVLTPQRVDTLEARQLGGEIVLIWALPDKFIDGRALGPITEAEIWLETRSLGTSPAEPPAFDPDEFLAKARLAAAIPAAKLVSRGTGPEGTRPGVVYRHPILEKDFTKLEYVFAVRVRETKRKTLSELSNEVRVRPRLVSGPPANVRTAVFQDRIDILWDPPAENFDRSSPVQVGGYNIYRLIEGALERKLNEAPVANPPFADRDFAFGTSERYMVRAIAGTPGTAVESADSPAVDVVPKDTFPPAVPDGLTAVTGAGLITLIWNPNPEADLLGYRVWRRGAGTAEFSLLTAQPLLENTYTDTAIEKGRRYEYAVSAVDRTNNESARSAAVFEMIKGE